MSVNTDRAIALVRHGLITERRSCLSKSAFAIRTHALGAAKRLEQKTGRKATVYSCTYCGHYHIAKGKHGENET